MNVKEMETLVRGLEAQITAMGGALEDIGSVARADREAADAGLVGLGATVEALRTTVENMGLAIGGLSEGFEDLRAKVEGRNRSAPVKRNMTDEDAMNVMTGEVKDLGHKEAAALIGLTYAQVYSCRLEYTFKHVHKVLKEGGFKNPHQKK